MILVHGISQEGKSAKKIHDEWMASLRPQFGEGTSHPLDGLTRIDAAFYGDILHKLSSAKFTDEAIALGVDDADSDFDAFAADALLEMAKMIGITEEQITVESAAVAVPQAAGPHKKWLKAIARAIEKVSPLKGALALRVLGQAHAYIRNQHVHDEVNALVRPLFEDDEPAVIIAHSLGTIVSFSLLREYANAGRPRSSPLFLTLGSPLAIDSVRRGFTKPRVRPANVERWVNCADPEDFVALHPVLTAEDYGPGIENLPDFENGYENAHGIQGYLSDYRVAKLVTEAIR